MPRDWSSLAKQSESHEARFRFEERHFKAALYQLVTSQVLYSEDRQQSTSYYIISRHRNEFREAALLMGLLLEFDSDYKYCYVLPENNVIRPQLLDLNETLALLVLRKLYHERALVGEMRNGEVIISIPEFQHAFTTETKREFKSGMNATDLRDFVQNLKRYGVVKIGTREDGDVQPFSIIIQPAIRQLLDETTISRLGAYQASITATEGTLSQQYEEHELDEVLDDDTVTPSEGKS